MAASSSRLMQFWNHPAGPKTIHFWAPTFKWGITLANVADFWRPADRISYPQQTAVTATGLIWSRFSTQITPVNYNLLTVNAFMAVTGIYQLSRKLRLDYGEQLGLSPKIPAPKAVK
ncbi:hypothetical protein WJX81_008537 [Elliptochloris bilobata]|uniref:Mitochondrial pyruvate carrier n=1 Tax=Elliptochloris bilobata TaxID=381761 RepID=A0AAW1QVZ6_9CHLO